MALLFVPFSWHLFQFSDSSFFHFTFCNSQLEFLSPWEIIFVIFQSENTCKCVLLRTSVNLKFKTKVTFYVRSCLSCKSSWVLFSSPWASLNCPVFSWDWNCWLCGWGWARKLFSTLYVFWAFACIAGTTLSLPCCGHRWCLGVPGVTDTVRKTCARFSLRPCGWVAAPYKVFSILPADITGCPSYARAQVTTGGHQLGQRVV